MFFPNELLALIASYLPRKCFISVYRHIKRSTNSLPMDSNLLVRGFATEKFKINSDPSEIIGKIATRKLTFGSHVLTVMDLKEDDIFSAIYVSCLEHLSLRAFSADSVLFKFSRQYPSIKKLSLHSCKFDDLPSAEFLFNIFPMLEELHADITNSSSAPVGLENIIMYRALQTSYVERNENFTLKLSVNGMLWHKFMGDTLIFPYGIRVMSVDALKILENYSGKIEFDCIDFDYYGKEEYHEQQYRLQRDSKLYPLIKRLSISKRFIDYYPRILEIYTLCVNLKEWVIEDVWELSGNSEAIAGIKNVIKLDMTDCEVSYEKEEPRCCDVIEHLKIREIYLAYSPKIFKQLRNIFTSTLNEYLNTLKLRIEYIYQETEGTYYSPIRTNGLKIVYEKPLEIITNILELFADFKGETIIIKCEIHNHQRLYDSEPLIESLSANEYIRELISRIEANIMFKYKRLDIGKNHG